MGEVLLRFRHTSGDIGPYTFSDINSVQQIKERLFLQWPKEGPLSKENPQSAADLRLLCAGKFLDNNSPLKDYRKEMGEPEPGAVVTMHILVRPPAAAKAGGKETQSQKEPKSGCACVVC